ncbi:MAG: carbohydrate ABC transporter permease, partial [Microterricola sp.]
MFRYTKATAAREVLVWIVTLIGLLPLYILVVTAFKTDEEALTTSAIAPPSSLDFSAFIEVLTTGGRNSIPMSIL